MSERKFIIAESDLLRLLEMAHELSALQWAGVDNWWGYMDSESTREYFLHQVPINVIEELSDEEFDKLMDDIWFEDLAKWDLELYAEYKEKCGNECQFKFKAKPTKLIVDNH